MQRLAPSATRRAIATAAWLGRREAPAADAAPYLALAAAAAAAATLFADQKARLCACEQAPKLHTGCKSDRVRPELKHSLIKNLDFIYACSCTDHKGKFEDCYAVEKQLGSGAFGTVLLARHKGLGHRRAVKKVAKDSNQQNAELMREIHTLMDLDHPNIVKLIRYFDEGPHIYLVFDLCEGPELFDHLKRVVEAGQRFSELEASEVLRQMLQALKCCHTNYMGHFDVKPENFMYHSNDSFRNLKMIDLGLSSSFKRDDQEIRGTAEYMAPEVWKGVYGPEADIWSCGAVFYSMLTGSMFIPQGMTEEQIQKCVHDRTWVSHRLRAAQEKHGLTEGAFELLCSMLRHNRHQRPTAREALCHTFLASRRPSMWHRLDSLRDGSPQPSGEKDPQGWREAAQVLDRILIDFHTFAREPVLKRATLLIMAHVAAYSFKESRPQRRAFTILDRNLDGELSIEALETFYIHTSGKIPDSLDDDFSGVDVDGDGCITYMEFLSATLPDAIRYNEQLVLTVFQSLDRNQDGRVDAEDLAAAFRHGRDPEGVCRLAMAEVGDGSGSLSRQEFLKLMCPAVAAAQ